MPGPRSDAVEAVLRACELLRAFTGPNVIMRVQDLADRTRLHKATVSRLLRTLETAGFVEKVAQRGFRSLISIAQAPRLRIGYASQTETSLFAHEVTESVRRAAETAGVQLLVFDNKYDIATTRRNAARMIEERVDVAIDFQTFERLAQEIPSKFEQARIPLISVDLPMPGATYFGADNYTAGRIAGRALGRWAHEHWGGNFDFVLLIELASGGPLLESRMAGARAGLNEVMGAIEAERFLHLDGANTFEGAHRVAKKHTKERCLILAMNDPNALGALAAYREQGREDRCAVAGQGATVDARNELRKAETRLIGTVAYFPERYGEALLRAALDILQNKPLPPALYTRHRLVTSANVNRIYPGDAR